MRYEVFHDHGQLICRNRMPSPAECSEWGCDRHVMFRVLLLFDKEELKYDIANVAYSQGDVARVNDNYGHDLLGENREHLMHQWKDVCEDGNYDRVLRTEALAVSEVEQMLYRYTSRGVHRHVSLDNQQEAEKEFLIELFVPFNFSDTTCWYLLRLIHEYIVDRVLEDWASITFPEAQERWKMAAMETADKISVAKTMCGSPVHHVNPTII